MGPLYIENRSINENSVLLVLLYLEFHQNQIKLSKFYVGSHFFGKQKLETFSQSNARFTYLVTLRHCGWLVRFSYHCHVAPEGGEQGNLFGNAVNLVWRSFVIYFPARRNFNIRCVLRAARRVEEVRHSRAHRRRHRKERKKSKDQLC